uniref:Uncharacterized protein n=1 Tax=Setaria viridis TaxID=4556 RepID=A0A4U6V1M1_SETVI|nr:hypothetical protein SEVIR_4G135601v2 [Setaria viridis]
MSISSYGFSCPRASLSFPARSGHLPIYLLCTQS